MRITLLALLLYLSTASTAQETIDVITMEYPPFTTEERSDQGISVAFLKTYAETHFKVPYRVVFLPPARAQARLSRGDWCLSFFPPESSCPKARWITLADKNVQLGIYRLSQPQPFQFTSIDELEGSIAFLRSRSQSGIHKIIKESNLKIYRVESVKQGIRMLLAGRVDYAFGDDTTAATYSGGYYSDKLQFNETPLLEGPVGLYYNTKCADRIFKDSALQQFQ